MTEPLDTMRRKAREVSGWCQEQFVVKCAIRGAYVREQARRCFCWLPSRAPDAIVSRCYGQTRLLRDARRCEGRL